MKTLLIPILLFITIAGSAQVFTEKIKREFVFEKRDPNNALMVYNINGNVKIEGYAGDKIIVEVERIINGKTEVRLALGKEEIQLRVLDRADTILLYVLGPCNEFGRVNKNKNKRANRYNHNGGWDYNWNHSNDNDSECARTHHTDDMYDYKMNFTIKVPLSVNLLASTINQGDVEVTGTSGYVNAENINGSIHLKNIYGATYAHTINGSIDINYSGNPSGDSKYYSLNGDITAYFKKGLAAQLTFKSFNGNFYSSVGEIAPMAVTVEKYSKGEGIAYKVNGNRYKIRGGGPLLDFETFNGDVFLREQE